MKIIIFIVLILSGYHSYSQQSPNQDYMANFYKNTGIHDIPIYLDSASYQRFIEYLFTEKCKSIVLGLYYSEDMFFKPVIENKIAPSCSKVLNDFTVEFNSAFDLNQPIKDFRFFSQYKFYRFGDTLSKVSPGKQLIVLYSKSYGRKYKQFFVKLKEVCALEDIILTIFSLDPLYLH